MVGGGKIVKIELENFKSYKGKHVIGPFKDFTAVIGPNGAGKSNLMDAISFVLGVKTTTLRGKKLGDLLYKAGGKVQGPGYVSMFFETNSGKELIFTRNIKTTGDSEYHISGKLKTREEYDQTLEELGGDVEMVAHSAKGIGEMIETISGSIEFKAKFDELKSTVATAEDALISVFSKKKVLNAEKKSIKEQMKEAQKFASLQKDLPLPADEQDDVQREFLQWDLYTIHSDLAEQRGKIANLAGDLKSVTSGLKEAQKEKETIEAGYGKSHKEIVGVQKERKQAEAEFSQKRPGIIEKENQVKHLTASIESDGKVLEKKNQDVELSQRKVREWNDQLSVIQKDRSKLEKLMASKEGGFKLQENQLKEYNELKQEAGRRTAELQIALERLSREEQGDWKMLDTKMEELQNRVKQLEEELQQSWVQRKLSRQASIKDLEKRRHDVDAQLKALQSEAKVASQRNTELTTKIQRAEEELREAKFDKRISERDQKFVDTLEALKRHFSGVHGRMLDLCQPSKPRYNVAVTVAMGANMDAIVVEDEKTAMECVQYLKEQRIGIATFLPLDSIKPGKLNESLRKQFTMVIDVINFDPKFQRAVQYAVGNTLLCDTLEDAKRACFGATRHNAVTIDGTVINKTGFMTGGVSGVELKAKRWDQKKVENLKRVRDKLAVDLSAVARALGDRGEEERLQAQVAALDGELRVQAADLEFVEKKIEEKNAEIANNKKQIGILERYKQTRLDHAAKFQQSIEETKAKMAAVEEEVFKDFSKRMKVPNIRVYQQTMLKEAEENHEKNTQLAKAESQLQEQISYENTHNANQKSEVDRIQKKLDDDKRTLATATEESAKRSKEGVALQKKIDALKKKESELQEQEKLTEAQIKDIRKQISTLTEKANTTKGAIAALEGEVERYLNQAAGLFEQGDREGMQIGGGKGSPEARLDAMDFEVIPRNLRSSSNAQDREKVSSQFRQQITALSNQVANLTPNMKAADRLSDVEQKVDDMNESFESARQEAQNLSAEFQRIKALRFHKFMDCFTHLEKKIDEVYQLLSVGSSDAFQGLAWIIAENREEPWEDGIKYSATPPNKRFRDMEQLSGGERSIAALALLFALHSYRPAPFFILDEIDAPLDPENVRNVVNYLRLRSPDTQFIVISLKESFYRHADGLVGIYKNLARGEVFSGVATLDLSKYPAE